MFAILKHLARDQRGVTALEYGLMAATTVVGLSAVLPPLVGALNTLFDHINHAL